ncbi:MAG: epoxyalkane--coenzyme M transferase [Dehalococcoidia bacterium]|nr:epoxyalkane--coenzyme M transferase [Dehalococcoidia bacterium]
MKRSTERILTTHTGSLPRPPALVEMLAAKELGKPYDGAAFDAEVRSAVQGVVRKQVECGVDVLNDGETSKMLYSTYVKDRLSGFDGDGTFNLAPADMMDFPDLARRVMQGFANAIKLPACNGPVGWKDREVVRKDIENLKAAVAGVQAAEVFMSAASPGVIALFLPNQFYRNHEEYVWALADVMKDEYNAIDKAGFVVQVDCPDLAMGRHIQFPNATTKEFLRIAQINVEALNHALSDIPPDRLRIHLCWGNAESPHHRDIPLKEILPIILKSRPSAISFVGANARHEHEWSVFKEIKLPAEKIIIPGVLDSTSNIIEHPELVAQRLVRYAGVVGRENVIAGTDCGFGTAAIMSTVDPKITWAKLQAMAEGARIASKELWGSTGRRVTVRGVAARRPAVRKTVARHPAARRRSSR